MLGLIKKIILATIVALLVQSLIIFIIGILLYQGNVFFDAEITELQEEVKDANHKLGINYDVDLINLGSILTSVGIAMMVMGGLASASFVFGIAVSFIDLNMLTAAYLALVVFMFIFNFIVVVNVLATNQAVKEYLEPTMKESLNDYKGDFSPDVVSATWNAIMVHYKCCGVNGFSDFEKLDSWNSYVPGNTSLELVTPRICCKEKSTDYTCALKGHATKENNYGGTGCIEVFAELVSGHIYVLVLLILSLIQLFILGVLLAVEIADEFLDFLT